MQSALGNSCAFIGIDADFLQQEAIELLPPAGVVLELLLDGVADKATLTRCQGLRARGYALAMTDYRGIDDRSRPLLPMVEVIKIDLVAADGQRNSGPRRLAAQAADQAAGAGRRQPRADGALPQPRLRAFQGRYFAQAEIVSGRRLSASQAALIRLINLVGRDVETPLIEDAFKHEPALTLNLLRVVNSVGCTR
jgi:EAL and modified HD-GYP domain-containing signal transduction protein